MFRIFRLVTLLATTIICSACALILPQEHIKIESKNKAWSRHSHQQNHNIDHQLLQNRDAPPPKATTTKSTISSLSRREALMSAATAAANGLVLSSLLLLGKTDPSLAALPCPMTKTILLTGANSGIGFEAAKLLAAQGANLILPCRTYAKSVATVQALTSLVSEQYGSSSSKLQQQFLAAECDLASLASIERFVTHDLQRNYLASLDAVCLNAGLARNGDAKDVARTQDGFELTVGTNHLGHFYLQHLLMPLLSKSKSSNGNTGRIVVTASSTHDPEDPAGGAIGVLATLGNLLGFERDGKLFSMVDGGEFNTIKAYKDSKVKLQDSCVLYRSYQVKRDASRLFTYKIVATDPFSFFLA